MKNQKWLAGLLCVMMLLTAMPMMASAELTKGTWYDYATVRAGLTEGASVDLTKAISGEFASGGNYLTPTATADAGFTVASGKRMGWRPDSNELYATDVDAVSFVAKITDGKELRVNFAIDSTNGLRFTIKKNRWSPYGTLASTGLGDSVSYTSLTDGVTFADAYYEFLMVLGEKTVLTAAEDDGDATVTVPTGDLYYRPVIGTNGQWRYVQSFQGYVSPHDATAGYLCFHSNGGDSYIKNIKLYQETNQDSVPVLGDVVSDASLLGDLTLAADMDNGRWLKGAPAMDETEGALKLGTAVLNTWTPDGDKWSAFDKQAKAIKMTAKVSGQTIIETTYGNTYGYADATRFRLEINKRRFSQSGTNFGTHTGDGALQWNGETTFDFSSGYYDFLFVREDDVATTLVSDGTSAVSPKVSFYFRPADAADSAWIYAGYIQGAINGGGDAYDYWRITPNADAYVGDIQVYMEIPQNDVVLTDGGNSIVKLNATDGVYSVSDPAALRAILSQKTASGKLILAGYNEEENLEVVKIADAATTNQLQLSGSLDEVSYIKVFLWDGFGNLNCIARHKVVEIASK